MKNRLSILAMLLICLAAVGCGRHSGDGDFPSDFDEMNDSEKVAYMMKHSEPDSVARFLCKASLGKISGVKIDTLATANLYALEHYKGENLDLYSREFEDYKASLPLADKLKMEKMTGTYDDDAIGYQLGLEYVGYIREKHLGVKDIEKDISRLHKVADAKTFERFMTGFKVALENDRGKDLPEEIYRRFCR